MKKIVKCLTVLALSLGISSVEAKISNDQFNRCILNMGLFVPLSNNLATQNIVRVQAIYDELIAALKGYFDNLPVNLQSDSIKNVKTIVEKQLGGAIQDLEKGIIALDKKILETLQICNQQK